MLQRLQCKPFTYLQDQALEIEVHALNMGRHRKWSLVARNPFATIRGHLGHRRKGVEGLCVSSLLGVLRTHTWLIGDEDVALLLLERDAMPHCQDRRAHSLSFSFCSSLADGGSEDLADPRSPSVDPHFSHFSQGKQSLALWSSSFQTGMTVGGLKWSGTLHLYHKSQIYAWTYVCI